MKRYWLFVIFTLSIFLFGSQIVDAITDDQIKSTVQIQCPVGSGYVSSGSGTLIRGDGIILTNKHVVDDATGVCEIGVTSSASQAPSFIYTADLISVAAGYDLALLSINEIKNGFQYTNFYNYYNSNNKIPKLGDSLEILGYPAIGGSTITFTKGYVVGQENIQSEYISSSYFYTKTDALMAPGSSGGGAYYDDGIFAGIPTAVLKDEIATIGYILPANLAKDFIKYNYTNLAGIPNNSDSYIEPSKNISGEFNSNLSVNLFTDSSKEVVIFDFLTPIKTDGTPYFEFSSGYHPSGVRGYYLYFGNDISADPVSDGIHLSFDSTDIGGSNLYPGTITEYAPPKITKDGEYYLRISIEANNGQISTPRTYFTYRYFVLPDLISNETKIKDGSLIRGKDQNDVYIVKTIGNKLFKRLVLSPKVFDSYGHLKWENIIEVSIDFLENFITSNLVRATAVGDPKTYFLYPEPVNLEGSGGDTGIKRWITDENIFNSLKLDWDAIYTINETDRDAYEEVEPL